MDHHRHGASAQRAGSSFEARAGVFASGRFAEKRWRTARSRLLDGVRFSHGRTRSASRAARARLLDDRGSLEASAAAHIRFQDYCIDETSRDVTGGPIPRESGWRPHNVDARPAVRATTDVVRDGLLPPTDRAGGPARHVRRHHDVRQFMEWQCRRQDILRQLL